MATGTQRLRLSPFTGGSNLESLGEADGLGTGVGADGVGAGTGTEAVQWLQVPAQAASVALLPLRLRKEQTPFGLLVLASPDAQRFHSGMGTDFLEHLAELCSAALSALLPAKA